MPKNDFTRKIKYLFRHNYKNCPRMREIWANYLLPKSLKTCPKSNKLSNLVTLMPAWNARKIIEFKLLKHLRKVLKKVVKRPRQFIREMAVQTTSWNLTLLGKRKLSLWRDLETNTTLQMRSWLSLFSWASQVDMKPDWFRICNERTILGKTMLDMTWALSYL